ncbi:MAG: ABC transporter permease [Clostridiales bacterium]|nr:ABC transporter permease [Clostridiales bacterium]
MSSELWREIGIGCWQTLYSSVISTVLATVIGLVIGVLLALTDKRGLLQNVVINKILGVIVNVLRSVPFLILFVVVMPFTRVVVGTTIGTAATIVPLTLAAAPFVARLTETAIKEVDGGIIEASLACGASVRQTIWRAILPEAMPSILANLAITFVTVVGYSAMTGFCGGGGLGAIAVNYGYYRNNRTVMYVAVVFIVVIVQVFQELGLWLAKRRDRRKK